MRKNCEQKFCEQTGVSYILTQNVMPKSPESEILAKFFADMGEKCGEKMAKFFADFRPSISKKSGCKKFHEKSATNSAGCEIKFFHRETLGVWGHNKTRGMVVQLKHP